MIINYLWSHSQWRIKHPTFPGASHLRISLSIQGTPCQTAYLMIHQLCSSIFLNAPQQETQCKQTNNLKTMTNLSEPDNLSAASAQSASSWQAQDTQMHSAVNRSQDKHVQHHCMMNSLIYNQEQWLNMQMSWVMFVRSKCLGWCFIMYVS